MKNQTNILLSFVGTNDAGKLIGKNDGAILTALKKQKFDEVILLWNRAQIGEVVYEKVVKYLKEEIKKRKYARKISDKEFNLSDVTDHNEIYLQLKEFTDTIPKNKSYSYTAAISSGTPAMQVCWILLAESGDFSETNPLQLIKVKDPQFGKSSNIPVKIDTALPQIIRLRDEVDKLKGLIPVATIHISKPSLLIGDVEIPLSPIELSYYRYFAERVLEDFGPEKFSGIYTSILFPDRIIKIHEEFFPDLDTNRNDLITINRKNNGLYIYTFRANVSKTNRKIKEVINKESVLTTFQISTEGQRGAKFYGIRAPKEKLVILK